MVHPLLKMLAMRPELMAEHLGAYAQLAAAEASEATAQLRHRALLTTATALLTLLGLGLAGAALLLLGALPLDGMPAPWLLLLVPLVPLGAAAACWMALKNQPAGTPFMQLRQQLSLDAALMHEAGDA